MGEKFSLHSGYYLPDGPWYLTDGTYIGDADAVAEYQKNVKQATTYTTTAPAGTMAIDTVELPEGILPGDSIAITAMPDVAALNQSAAEAAPEGYTFYGWQADSGVTVLTLLPEELEAALQALYDKEPEWLVTLTPLYQPVPEDDAESATEPTDETTEPTDPTESTEPTEPTDGTESTEPAEETTAPTEEETEPEDETPIPTEQPALLPKDQDEDSTEPAEDTPKKTEPDPVPTSESATKPISEQETQASE